MSRERFVPRRAVGLCAAVLGALLLATPSAHAKKVVVIGIDGLDPRLLERFMGEGVLPNFSRLAAEGDYKTLRTTKAPQSPVAWSTFITGLDPGGHGIYDFVHRDPSTMVPRFSMADTLPPRWSLFLGPWALPLSPARIQLRRQGRAFWELLGEKGVPTAIFRMPANFPPVGARKGRELSGMGTPDLLGTTGTFSYYTDVLPGNAAEFTGGQAYRVTPVHDVVEAKLHGPKNPFRREGLPPARKRSGKRSGPSEELSADFRVHLDRGSRAALFTVGGRQFLLREREWSDWIPLEFETLRPLFSVKAIARFYLKEISPGFKLYVSPLQLDPSSPAMPISSPPGWSAELCACQGYFSTLGLPHDTKAFAHGVLDGREFWDQLVLLDDESRRLFRHLLQGHRDGLLFFYFGSVDQGSHMLWHYMDEKHPNHTADDFLSSGIRRLYRRMDEALGQARAAMDRETTLVVLSDHGFAPFYREVNLNTWLHEAGYIPFRGAARAGGDGFFSNVDWRRTKAYAVGLNGLYVNVKGREKWGTVRPGADYEAVLTDLERGLLSLRDPATGQPVVTELTRPRRDFSGPFAAEGPDLIVGYGWGYRSSWESPLGGFPPQILTLNRNAWSGDHCIDSRLVPGVLMSNRKITLPTPGLEDVTVSVLDEYGVPPLRGMKGRDCLAEASPRTKTPPRTP